jgi:hypothetical protein
MKQSALIWTAIVLAFCGLAGTASAAGVPLARQGVHPIELRNTSGVTGETSTDIAPALRALHIRGQAMNERYHLGTAAVTTSAGFDWSAFGVGAGAMLGLVLLAGGLAVAGRVSRELGRVTPSRG